MSVCIGAFQLAKGWLALGSLGHNASRLHRSSDQAVSDIDVKRGLRFVDGTKIATAGGLSSGIDLALRVVDRYFGREVAQKTAVYMEYQSQGWIA